MDTSSALIAFSIAAALLTLTPGIDTALVLRTAAVEGTKNALLAGIGISAGVLGWGVIAALGFGALLAVSETAYAILQIAGAAYLVYLGLQMILSALRGKARAAVSGDAPGERRPAKGPRWFLRGMLTNLLNPKVGVFYVSFLPQFIPAGASVVTFSILLAAIHALMGVAWLGALTFATRPVARTLQRPAVSRTLDGITGSVLVAFGVRLALERQT
ncbi:LysE family translocator [Aquamicrobium sp. LC103]|uniref:LysE family translocator n=1 Tax=Aquamicrobium sp. LC103 TaxID=1120658 RepID=UPI00063E9B06|nr:LysE family translocator [Aquamicrobium sp. LC103]TKT80975.1 LysE family translocator [Aquamicrobium sp. LC103]